MRLRAVVFVSSVLVCCACSDALPETDSTKRPPLPPGIADAIQVVESDATTADSSGEGDVADTDDVEAADATDVPSDVSDGAVDTVDATGCGPGLAHCDGTPDGECLPEEGGSTELCAAPSCLSILVDDPSAPDGDYWIGDPPSLVTCDMTAGGWMRVADFDLAEDACPGDWAHESTAGVCYRNETSSSGGQRSAFFEPPAGTSWAQVRGFARGRFFGSNDGFRTGGVIESSYVDGLSITVGSPREHLWTYGLAFGRTAGETCCACPCFGGATPPEFVGGHFACQTRDGDGSWGSGTDAWTGVGFGPTGCDLRAEADRFKGASPFVRTLDTLRTDAIEARILADQESGNEDAGITQLRIDVREWEVCDGVDNDHDGLVDELGSCEATPADSCKAILDQSIADGGWVGDGHYWIDTGATSARFLYCDMTEQDGGWTLAAVCARADPRCLDPAAVGAVSSPRQPISGKLSDTEIRNLLNAGGRETRTLWRQSVRHSNPDPRTAVVFNKLADPGQWSSIGAGTEGAAFEMKMAEEQTLTPDVSALAELAYQSAYAPLTAASSGCWNASNGWSNAAPDGCGPATWVADFERGPSMSHNGGNAEERADAILWVR